MRVVLTDRAVADLERIGDAIARDNPSRAVTFVRELRASCLGLAEHPARFPLVPAYAPAGVRRRVHGNYLIFYRVGLETVEILHVLHGAMDYERILFPDADHPQPSKGSPT